MHTTATWPKTVGAPPWDAMDILGHSRLAITLEVYTAGADQSRRDAISKLASFGQPDKLTVADKTAVIRG